MNEQIQKTTNGTAIERRKPQTLADYFVTSLQPQLAAALPKHLTPDRMARVCLTALRTTPDLAKCTQLSFAGEVMKLAQLGLEPNTPLGHAWLIPRKNNKVDPPQFECTTIIGYQGYQELARRSGLVKNIFAHAVFEGDDFEYELGLHPKLRHVPRGKTETITHAYAVAHIDGADPIFKVLTLKKIEARKGRGAGGPAWRSDFEAMALKSAVRALWPWLPKSAEMAQLAESDDDGRPDIVTVAAQQHASASIVDALNASIENELPVPDMIDAHGEEVSNG